MTVPADWGKKVVDYPFLFHLSLMPFFLETFPPFESLVVHHCSPHLLLHHLLLRNCCWYCSPEETGQHELINMGAWTRTNISPVSTSKPEKNKETVNAVPHLSVPCFRRRRSAHCGFRSCWPRPLHHHNYSVGRYQQISLIMVQHHHHHYHWGEKRLG